MPGLSWGGDASTSPRAITITVRLFASLREAAGTDRLEFRAPARNARRRGLGPPARRRRRRRACPTACATRSTTSGRLPGAPCATATRWRWCSRCPADDPPPRSAPGARRAGRRGRRSRARRHRHLPRHHAPRGGRAGGRGARTTRPTRSWRSPRWRPSPPRPRRASGRAWPWPTASGAVEVGAPERRRGRLGRPPPGGLRRLPLRHRRAQAPRPDLEARRLCRRRRHLDRRLRAPRPRATRPASEPARRRRRRAPPAPASADVEDPLVAPPLPDLEEEIGEEEELWTDDSGEDYSGWYCVRTDPWPCPADGLRVRRPLPHRRAPGDRVAGDGRPGPAAPRGRRPRRGPQPQARPSTSPRSARPAPTTSGRPPGTPCTPCAATSAGTSTRRSEGWPGRRSSARPTPGPARRRPASRAAWCAGPRARRRQLAADLAERARALGLDVVGVDGLEVDLVGVHERVVRAGRGTARARRGPSRAR